jgi:hypothetical protein
MVLWQQYNHSISMDKYIRNHNRKTNNQESSRGTNPHLKKERKKNHAQNGRQLQKCTTTPNKNYTIKAMQ